MGDSPFIPTCAGPVGVFIVTHESREDVLTETLDHFREQGVHPHVQTQVEPPAPWRVRRGFRRGLERFSDPWPNGGILALEDDVRLRSDWRQLLEVIVQADYPTVCCTLPIECLPAPFSAWARAEQDGQLHDIKVKPRVAPLVRPIAFYGTQAIYIPKWFLPHRWSLEVLHVKPPSGKAFDGLWNGWMLDNPTPVGMMVSVPDLVDHTSPQSVLDPNRKPRKPHMFQWGIEW